MSQLPDLAIAESLPSCHGPHLVGWLPCICSRIGGHRSVYCQTCGRTILVPVCLRRDRSVAEHGVRF